VHTELYRGYFGISAQSGNLVALHVTPAFGRLPLHVTPCGDNS
jgi:hypothetical protein